MNVQTRLIHGILCLALGLAPTLPAHAQSTLYWSSDNSTQGGNGTWTDGSGFWGAVATGPWGSTWNNSNNDIARFGGTVGTVTLGGNVTVGGLAFDTAGYRINNGANTLSFGAANNGITFNNITAAAISGQLGGSGNATLSSTTPATAGTLTLNGTSTSGWNGMTTINAGMTVALSQSNQALLNTSGIAINGGAITLTNTNGTEAALNRISNSAAIEFNGGGTLTFANTSGATVYAETLGNVTVNSGQAFFNLATNQTGAGNQTLTLTSLSRSGTSQVAFGSGTGGGVNTTKNMVVVTGATATPAGQVIGPWAYANNGSAWDYAVYNGASQVLAAGIAGSAETTWTTANQSYTMSANQTLTATRTVTALRNAAATGVVTLATGANLETYGVLNGATTLLTVAPGTGGVLTTPSGGGNLYVAAMGSAITISAPITNNGAAVTLVKNGSNTVTLSSTTGNYSGGTVINAGSVSVSSNTNLGAAGTGITFDGSGTLTNSTGTTLVDFGSRPIALNNGATATFTSGSRGNMTFSGNVTGSGGITVTSGSFWQKLSFTSTSNTFTGAITDSRSGNDGIANALLSFNSIADVAGAGNIILNAAANSGIDYGSGAIASLDLNHRQIILVNNNTVFFNNASSQAVNINTDIGFSGTGARQIRFGISGRSGSGVSSFNGKLTDNVGGAFTPTVNGGTWAFTNNNTYTGVTSITGGTLRVTTLANGNATSSIGASSSDASNLLLSTGTRLQYVGSGNSTDRSFTINGTANGHNAILDASGTGAINFTNSATPGYGTANQTRTLTLTGSNTDANTLAAVLANNGSGAVSVNKLSAGRWVLTGTNTYTGNTTINAGVIQAVDGVGLPTASILELRGGVLQSSGNFTRTVGTAAGNVNWSTSSGGFSAIGGALNVRLNGGTASVTWNGASMVQTGQTLNFGSASADSMVDFQNALNLGSSGSGQRTISVVDNLSSASDFARMSGNITNTAAGWGIIKAGNGTLELTGTNTYTGNTTVNAGTLLINGNNSAATGIITVAAGASLGGTGTIGSNLTFSSTSVFEVENILDPIAVTGTISFGAGFGIANLSGIDWGSLDLNSPYTLITTNQTFSTSDISNFGLANAADVGGGRSAYFQNGSLQLVVVPEPATIVLLGVSVAFLGLRLARRRQV